jgi:signal transduction histidine kinase
VSGSGGISLQRRLATTLLALGLVLLLVVAAALALALQTRDQQQQLTGDYFETVQDSHQGFVRVLDREAVAIAYLRRGAADDLARLRQLERPRPDAVSVDELRRRLTDAPGPARRSTRCWPWPSPGSRTSSAPSPQSRPAGTQALPPTALAAVEASFAELRIEYDRYIEEVVTGSRRRGARPHPQAPTCCSSRSWRPLATAVVAAALLYAALRRWVTVPLTALRDETRVVRTGSLDHVVHVDGPPEITGWPTTSTRCAAAGDQLAEVARQRLLEQQPQTCHAPTATSSSSPTSPRTTCRSRCARCQLLPAAGARYKGQLDERAEQYLEFAVDGAKRMQLLINDLLAFSRVGRMADAFVDVELDGVLAEVLRTLSTRVAETGAVVTSDPLPVVPGERRLLVQLLQNLIGNALKFSGEAPPRVHLSAQQREDAWELAVTDDGIGIEPQYAERIFVIFQRLHPKAEYEGTGIGLALCKKIVEHHGGQMWLDTEAASGATFRFTLPTQPPVPVDEQADDAPEGAREERAWSRV